MLKYLLHLCHISVVLYSVYVPLEQYIAPISSGAPSRARVAWECGSCGSLLCVRRADPKLIVPSALWKTGEKTTRG